MDLLLRFRWTGPGTVLLAALLAAAGQPAEAQQTAPPPQSAPQAAPDTPETPRQKIDRLIAQLGNDDFAVRDRAQAELARIGFEACDALRIAENDDDLEIAARARYLLRLMRVRWSEPDDPAEVKEILKDYSASPPDERVDLMRKLIDLPGGAGLPAMCRLVRYEKSTRLSKQAAVQMLNLVPLHQPGRQRLAEAVAQHLAQSGRTAAVWLRQYVRLLDAPAETLDGWRRLVEEEARVLARFPAQTGPTVLASLLYHQAQAEAQLGQAEAAEATAVRARQTPPPGREPSLLFHLEMALSLRQRGRFDWAEAEYRQAAHTGPPVYAASALKRLAEMLHDNGEDLRAAETLDETSKLVKKENLEHLDRYGMGLSQLAGRMNYFYACHWLQQGDLAKQRSYLDEALSNDPMELDTLIARYRLANLAPDERQKTVQMIEKAAADLRQKIAASQDPISNCNQLAWLVGNTQGDLDEALECARRAVAARPDAGAYWDTLARVDYARGDYQGALENQQKAVTLEPHSGLIAKQLEVFRRAAQSPQKDSGSAVPDGPAGTPVQQPGKKPREPAP